MDKCAKCKYAICETIKGYSSKECGLPSGSMITIVGCYKEADAFYDGGEDCDYYQESDYE